MKPSVRRRVLVVALLFLGACLVVGFGCGPVVRGKIAAVAATSHLTIGVEGVRPGFFSITLHNVSVAPEGEPGISVLLPEVRVELSATLVPQRVEAHRGEIVLEGTAVELQQRLARWRARREPQRVGGARGSEREVFADGLALRWKAPDGSVEIAGGAISHEGGKLELRADLATARRSDLELIVRGATVELDGERRLRAATGASVQVGVTLKESPPEAPRVATGSPAPPPLPMDLKKEPKKGNAKAAAPAPPATGEPFTPIVPLPDLAALRSRLALLARAVAEIFPEGSEVRTPALSIDVRGPTPMTLGPGPLTFLRQKDALVLSFKSGGSPPISVEVQSPVAAGEPSLTVDGGPLPLSLLGLREGALGFVEVGKATALAKGRIVLDATGTSATFDGELRLGNASLNQPRLSRETLRDLTLAVAGRGLLTSTSLRLDDGHVTVGTTRVGVHGTVEQDATHLQANVALEVPGISCQDLAASVPSGLLPTVRGVRFAGTFTARGRLTFDTKNLDALELDYAVDDRCRALEAPSSLSRERFTTVFTHSITHPDGSRGEARTGPGSGNWTELGAISPFMQVAVTTTEDGSFFRHHGFNHTAIKQSFVANVKARRFVRGASTITMQLAKNLFLVREKTLSRKLEEIVLADYLEQIFRKDDILELYLNVVEFGPDVYGITQAAEHYFGRAPLELNLSECLFLASVLPSPVRSHRLSEHGELPEHWQRHLQQLMRIAERSHRISPAELEEGLAERVVFHRAGSPRPPQRPPRKIRGESATDAPDGEPEWHHVP